MGETKSDPVIVTAVKADKAGLCQSSLGAEPTVMHTSHDLQQRNAAVQEIN